MGAIGTIAKGYDPGYLLKESSKGLDSGYYLSAVDSIGEPPGVWTGRGCPELGLAAGGEVEEAVMKGIYGKLLDPRDPAFADDEIPDKDKAHLGSKPRKYKTFDTILSELLAKEPDAGPERREVLEIEAAKKTRQAVFFFDYTFSADKSISVLHAGLQASAARAERTGDADAAAEFRRMAGVVEEAVRAGAAAALEYAQDRAGYSRCGRHAGAPKDTEGRPLADHGTGRFIEARNWVIASFLQFTSRDGDPQMHVHNAVLNRVKCADGVWRTLDSRAFHWILPAANAVGARVLDEYLARELGTKFEPRPDGKTRELTGVPQQVKKLFSSRRAVITEGVAELAAAYEGRHKRPPNARVLWAMAQHVTLKSRQGKKDKAPSRQELLDTWAAQTTAAELGELYAIPDKVLGSRDAAQPGLDALAGKELDEVLAAAVAEVQKKKATWTRPQLMAAIDRQLPAWLGGLDAAAITRVLEELTDRALAGQDVIDQEAPDLVPVPASLRRADGRNVYSPPGKSLFTTKPHLDSEEQLLAAGGQAGGPAADPGRAAAVLGISPAALETLPGRVPADRALDDDTVPDRDDRRFAGGLRPDQAGAVYGILTSGRKVDTFIGPAGTGKSRAMNTLAGAWTQTAGGRVIGVAVAEAAAQVLADEGLPETFNVARFLSQHAKGKIELGTGDLLIVDEASMVGTAELTALHAITAAAGAKLLLTGDPAQLSSVTAGGAFGMLAGQHGCYRLSQVQRMTEEWERSASLRLRAGDSAVIADYDARGRLAEGSPEAMGEAAYRGWLGDHLSGRDSLLIASTNEQAAELSARARGELAAMGLVDQDAPLQLADGNSAGRGDLVQARRNDRDIEDADGRWVTNRDVWLIDGYIPGPRTGTPQAAVVRRSLGHDRATGERRWSEPFQVPASYLAGHAALGYASTVHTAQGRTVDTAQAVLAEGLPRSLVYVAMTRGRLANYTYAVTRPATPPGPGRTLADKVPGRQRAADLQSGTRTAPALAEPGKTAPDSVQDRARTADRDDGTEPWAPEANRYSVLAAALEADDAPQTAIGTRRNEAARAGHMAHLGAIWSSEIAAEYEHRYDRILARLLTPAEYERYLGEDARTSLHRQVRAAELAGHDPARVLARAVRSGPLEDNPVRGRADDISKVLHWRIDQRVGNPAPNPGTYLQRTPAITGDPELNDYLHELARHLDARQAELGRRTAGKPPEWATARLGPLPADPDQRDDWIRRAGAVAAYRELTGHADPDRAIGREPAAPEARAAWHAAASALGADPAQLDLARKSDGDLHAIRARYRRELAWAPPHVGDELRATALSRREHAAEASIAAAYAESAADTRTRTAAAARAQKHRRLAEELAVREEKLTAAADRRTRWHESTTEIREAAITATEELRRRGTDPSPLEPAVRRAPRDLRADDANKPGDPGEGPRQIEDHRQDQSGCGDPVHGAPSGPVPAGWPPRPTPGHAPVPLPARRPRRPGRPLRRGPEHGGRGRSR